MNEHENRQRVYRATFDTNIFVSSVIRKGNLPNRLLSLWREGRFVGEVSSTFELCRDANDNMLVDCAISGRVQFLVSNDNDLLDDAELEKALFEYGVAIVNPPVFMEKIREV